MNNELNSIIDLIKEVAKQQEIDPSRLTKTMFMKHAAEKNITEWTLRKYGGLTGIIKTYYPFHEKSLAIHAETKELRGYVSKLENKLSEREIIVSAIENVVKEKIVPLKNVKTYSFNKRTSEQEHREMTVMFNDTHFGLKVVGDEVGDINQYDWQEASRRTAFIVNETCRYKKDKRKYVKRLNVVINGDILQGVIHDLTARTADLMIHQVNGALHILGHAITRFSENFNEVVVYLIGGNHEDMPHRREGGHRVSSHPYDNFCNIVGFSLSAMFKDVPNVQFVMPKTPYVYINTIGGRIMAVHGHQVFSKALGNPGRNINVKSLSDEIHRFNMGEIAKGNDPIRMVLMGHVHTHASFTTYDGVLVYIAPSLSGVDSYAHNTLNINQNFIGQILFETTKNYMFGDSRLIQPNVADKMEELDKIIPPFKNKLSWE